MLTYEILKVITRDITVSSNVVFNTDWEHSLVSETCIYIVLMKIKSGHTGFLRMPRLARNTWI